MFGNLRLLFKAHFICIAKFWCPKAALYSANINLQKRKNMLELNLQPVLTIATARLQLRDLEERDIPQLFWLRSNDRVMQYIDVEKPATEADSALHYERLKSGPKNNTGISWAITLKEAGEMIGNIGLFNIQKEHYRTEIGYFLHPDYHRKGIMFEAITAVCDFAFSKMKIHSIEANVNPENIASRKLLEKIGFRQEAYFRENFYYNGNFLDSAIYCLVAPK